MSGCRPGSSLGIHTGGEVVKRYAKVMAIAVLVAACGGTSADTDERGDEAASQVAGSDQTESTGVDTTDGPGEASIDDVDLGEDGELGLDDFIPGARSGPMNEADIRAEEMAIQQQIAECMAGEGFEYIPFVPSGMGGGFGFEEEDHGEWVKKYGFGVSTFPLMDEEFGFGEESDPWADDPNRPIVEAMDELEQEEYYRILYGGEPEIIENTPREEIEAMTLEEQEQFFDDAYSNWVSDGCEPKAYEEAYGGGAADMAFWEEFSEDLDDFWTRAEADPRIVEAQAGWSACMAEKGHNYTDQEAMFAYFHGTEVGGEWVEGEFGARVNELITWPGEDFMGEAGEGGYVDTTAIVEGEEGEEGEEAGEPEWEYQGPEYDLELLQPLIDEEIAVAVADWECSQDMWELSETVYKELEQQFVEENLDRLVAFKAENP